MENHSTPSVSSVNQVYGDFYRNYYADTISYWMKHSQLTRETIEDIIGDAVQEHFRQVKEAADPQRILNCPYLLGIVRNMLYTAFRKQNVARKEEDLDDDDLQAPSTTRSNAPRFVYIEELSGVINDDGDYSNTQFSHLEYELYCNERNAVGVDHYRRQLIHRLIELLHTLDHNHELLFRYHYGLGVPKLTFAQMAPLTGFSNGDSAKVVFDRKKKQLIKLAHAA